MIPFQTGQSASSAHQALKTTLETMDRAKDQAVLWFGEIHRRRLYIQL